MRVACIRERKEACSRVGKSDFELLRASVSLRVAWACPLCFAFLPGLRINVRGADGPTRPFTA